MPEIFKENEILTAELKPYPKADRNLGKPYYKVLFSNGLISWIPKEEFENKCPNKPKQ